MEHARTVWVLADGAGRQLLRRSVSRRRIELVSLLVGCAFVGLLSIGVHGALLAGLGPKADRMARELGVLQQQTQALAAQLPRLEGLLESNQAQLTQLERKSGFRFVSLAKGEALPRALVPAAQAGPAEQAPDAREAAPLQQADEVQARGVRLEAWLGDLLEYWHDAERRLANTPSVRPARTAWLSSSFGVRTDPINFRTVMHKGLDMAGYVGMLVYAPADGVVIWTGTRGGYGQVVVVDHGWGLQTHYAHLSKYVVRQGDRVQRGEPLAEMGNTGKSTGPHLHYEVRQDGYPIDPRNFILD